MAKRRFDIVVLNRGAHYQSDAQFLEGWRHALEYLREAYPDTLIVARNTPPGHKGCSQHMQPLAKPPPSAGMPHHWGAFRRQNTKLARLLASEFPGVVPLDVATPTALRADMHRLGSSGKDCLHYTEPQGPIDYWVRLLYAALRMVNGLTSSSAAGGKSARALNMQQMCHLHWDPVASSYNATRGVSPRGRQLLLTGEGSPRSAIRGPKARLPSPTVSTRVALLTGDNDGVGAPTEHAPSCEQDPRPEQNVTGASHARACSSPPALAALGRGVDTNAVVMVPLEHLHSSSGCITCISQVKRHTVAHRP